MRMSNINMENIEEQIYNKRKDIRYDIRDLTVEFIHKKFDDGIRDSEDNSNRNILFIPEYQREFTWDNGRQSKLIESIILGLPIPFLFVAEDQKSRWEIVDGSQRIRTIHSFISDELVLEGLESLSTINGLKFSQLEKSRQGKILDTALRFIVLSEETTDDVKFSMFERINLGSDLLKAMEKRKGLYPGKFTEFIYEYVESNDKFKKLTPVDVFLENRQERNELLLRFFAISDDMNYKKSIGTISSFLDEYLKRMNNKLDKDVNISLDKYKDRINEVNDFVEKIFPYGFRHARNPQTKRAVFEAISVGTFLALQNGEIREELTKDSIEEALKSTQFKNFINSNKLHSKSKLLGRIEYIYNLLTGKSI